MYVYCYHVNNSFTEGWSQNSLKVTALEYVLNMYPKKHKP